MIRVVEVIRRLIITGTRPRAEPATRSLGKFQIPAEWEIETPTGTKYAIVGATGARASGPDR